MLRRRRALLLALYPAALVLAFRMWRWCSSESLFFGDSCDAHSLQTALLLGADPGHRSIVTGQTLLVAAANGWEPEAVRVLLRWGADPNAVDAYGTSALMHAARRQDPDMVVSLLRAHADPNRRDAGGTRALHFAAGGPDPRTGEVDVRVAEALLDAGADPSCANLDGRTPLSAAAGCGHIAVVRLLLARGARPGSADRYGWTPLMWAAWRGDAEGVRALLAYGADPKGVSRRGQTAASLAREAGATDVVRLLARTTRKLRAVGRGVCADGGRARPGAGEVILARPRLATGSSTAAWASG